MECKPQFTKVDLSQISIHPKAKLPFSVSTQHQQQSNIRDLPLDPRLMQTVFSDIPMVILEPGTITKPRYLVYSNWTILLPQHEDTLRGKKIPVLVVDNITKGAIEVEAWRFLFNKIATAIHRKQIIPSATELLANCPDEILQKLLPSETRTFIDKASYLSGESVDAIRYAQKQLRD